jgi:fucose permease
MSFTGANIALTLIAFSMFGVFFFMSQFLQTVQNYTALESGVRLLPMAVAAFIGAVSSAKIAQKLGTKLTVAIGILIAASGFFYFYRIATVNVSYLDIAIGMCITSLGMGVTMSPATNSIMGSIPVDEAGVGSAMNDTTRQIGGALGVAILGTLFNSTYALRIDNSLGKTLPADALTVIRGGIQGAHYLASKQAPAIGQLIISKADEAFTYSMAHTLLTACIIMTVAAVVVLLIVPTRVRPYSENKIVPPPPSVKDDAKHQ